VGVSGMASFRATAAERAQLALPLFLIVAVWSLAAWLVTALRGIQFPTPWLTALRLLELLAGEEYLQSTIYGHLAGSVGRWLIGFSLAVVAGTIAGIALGWSGWLRRAVMPVVAMMQTIPSLAWVPVAILVMGLGSAATVFIIFLAGVFAMTVNVTAGVRSVDAVFIKAALMMGADNRQLLCRVLLPGALPHLLSGLRVALANGWRSLIAAEMVAGDATGLGYAIFQARWNFDYVSAFACIVLIAAVGLAVEACFTLVERRSVERWGIKVGGE
jgi:ABC-type nitrate/sulfonate/bicarbonate transport system permease component